MSPPRSPAPGQGHREDKMPPARAPPAMTVTHQHPAPARSRLLPVAKTPAERIVSSLTCNYPHAPPQKKPLLEKYMSGGACPALGDSMAVLARGTHMEIFLTRSQSQRWSCPEDASGDTGGIWDAAAPMGSVPRWWRPQS